MRWSGTGEAEPYEVATTDIAGAVFTADREVWVLALAPTGTTVEQPSWAPFVDQVSADG